MRLGLLVNPIAGMGGRVALKGTDGEEALRIARERGATPVAPGRARRALGRLDGIAILAAPGAMGAEVAAAAGFDVETTDDAAPSRTTGGGPPAADGAAPSRTAPDDLLATDRPGAGDTTAADTRAAVAEMLRRDVDLLLFAGGDGTARDIHDAIGSALPLVGVPTGVKMHSGVFAATPDAAAAAVAAFRRAPTALREAEIADVDEDAATRLYGRALVPRQPALMLGPKAPSPVHDAALHALCREIAATMAPGRLYLLGPGTTTAAIVPGTLLGVDAVRDGAVVAADLDEAGLLGLLDDAPDATLVLGVVGGQGSLLGRGNQQLSPRVLRRLGPERIEVVAAADKLLALNPPILRVDTGGDDLDRALSGHRRVRVAPGRTIVMKVST